MTGLSWIFKNKDHGASKTTTQWPVPDFDVYDFVRNYELDFGISASVKLSGRIFYMIDILDVLHTVGEKFTDHTDHIFYQHGFPCLIEQLHIQRCFNTGLQYSSPITVLGWNDTSAAMNFLGRKSFVCCAVLECTVAAGGR